jgi:hypothetical protein
VTIGRAPPDRDRAPSHPAADTRAGDRSQRPRNRNRAAHQTQHALPSRRDGTGLVSVAQLYCSWSHLGRPCGAGAFVMPVAQHQSPRRPSQAIRHTGSSAWRTPAQLRPVHDLESRLCGTLGSLTWFERKGTAMTWKMNNWPLMGRPQGFRSRPRTRPKGSATVPLTQPPVCLRIDERRRSPGSRQPPVLRAEEVFRVIMPRLAADEEQVFRAPARQCSAPDPVTGP